MRNHPVSAVQVYAHPEESRQSDLRQLEAIARWALDDGAINVSNPKRADLKDVRAVLEKTHLGRIARAAVLRQQLRSQKTAKAEKLLQFAANKGSQSATTVTPAQLQRQQRQFYHRH